MLENRLLPSGRGVGRVGQRGAEVGVEDDRRASLLRPPRDVEDELAGALRDRHRDPGQVDDLHTLERLVRHIADSHSRRGRAGTAVGDVGAARPSATCRRGRSVRRRAAPSASRPLRARSAARIMSPNGSRPSLEIQATSTPSRASAIAKFDSAPANRSVRGMPSRSSPSSQRVEERHRLAEREDGHVRVVDREPGLEVEEVEPPRVDARPRSSRRRPGRRSRLEPRDQHRAPLHRLRLEPLERGGVDVARDLAHFLGEHRLGGDLEVDEELRAERLGRANRAAQARLRRRRSPRAGARAGSRGRSCGPAYARRRRTLSDHLGRDRQLLLADLERRDRRRSRRAAPGRGSSAGCR